MNPASGFVATANHDCFSEGDFPERDRFPRLAYYAAEHALAQQRPARELERHLEAVQTFRDTTEGRRHPGTHALLARLATATGNGAAAMRYADAAYRERATRAEPWLGRAAAHVAKGELPGAWAALAQASGLLPGDPRIARLRAEIAMRRGETRSLAEVPAPKRDPTSWIRSGAASR